METLSPEKLITLIRLMSVLIPLTLAWLLICMQRVTLRHLTGIYLAVLWCFLTLLFLNPLIIQSGGWSFPLSQMTFHQTPVDLVIGWAMVWGAIPHLSRTRLNLWTWLILLFGLDVAVMPLLAPVVTLHESWMLWDALCLAVAFVPSWYLARWTRERQFVYARAFLQMILFTLIFNVLIPLIIIEEAYIRILPVPGQALYAQVQPYWLQIPVPLLIVYLGGLLLSLVPGLSALQEFALRGWGTPFPMDPPVKLVTTGPYAYLTNPMQVSQTLIYFWLGVLLDHYAFYFAAVLTLFFSRSYARWVESGNLAERFGPRWVGYRANARPFIPKWKPHRLRPATVYLDLYGCRACARVGKILSDLKPIQLTIKDARFFPDEDLKRMHYKDADGYQAGGIHALGRCMEHINLMWAFAGWIIRLPGISHAGQVVIDALFPPHRVCRIPSDGREIADR
ncbi:MAG: hypothetical protein GWN88_23035 [Nitrospinaceae bacterium]|nr:hypothetical protein [Nitrospinaceae bacterium]NIS87743.1 hypothetical protein [Nitrospinaceae bacterium]NIT84613.1 hypothetical protein [Nitrospinaceae bacterium]NIU46792.1 hypothetical protein [Nitrospinaceae bacterium]NIU98994.1 hypothetical protein [Nitrospinaceae bacterium]